MSTSIEDLVKVAWIQVNSGLVECALDTLGEIISRNPALTPAQQNLFDNIETQRVAGLRSFLKADDKDVAEGDDLSVVKIVKKEVFEKLKAFTADAVELIDRDLLPKALDARAKAFFLRKKGDFLRYIAEEASGTAKQESTRKACESYQESLNIAQSSLPKTDAVLLATVVNFCVFKEYLMDDRSGAEQLARATLADYNKANESRVDEVAPEDAEEESHLTRMLNERYEEREELPEEEETQD